MIRPRVAASADEPQLPFDPVTVAFAFLSRWRVAALIILAAGLAGVTAGFGGGTRVYTSETVLLHRPRPSVWIGARERGVDSLSLRTKLNLVKVRTNLEEVRERLDLTATIAQIGSAVAVSDQRETDLLIVRSEWSDPVTARDLATTMSDVFLKSQVLLRYREERSVVEQLRRDAIDEADRLQAQLDDFGRITADLQQRIALEREDSPEDEGLGQLSIRMSQLRDAIQDDQSRRANDALLKRAELQLTRVEALHRTGAATDQELERARSERDRQEALTVDTEQISEWRAELQRLQNVVLPSDENVTASAPLLQAVMFRALEAEFDLASARERVAQYEAVHDALDEQVAALEEYRGDPSGSAAPAGLAESDFQVVTPARIPVRPSRSNRRIVAIAAFVLLVVGGLFGLAGFELVSTRVRSGRELALRADVPVLGAMPVEPGLPESDTNGDPRYRILAQTLLGELPAQGTRLLITSAERGEGRTTTAVRFARALGELGERVLVVDASGRAPDRAGLSLSNALGVTDEATAQVAPCNSRFASVDYLSLIAFGPGAESQSAGTPAFNDVLAATGQAYRLVLIDGPAVLPDADAQRLVDLSDGVLMVTLSHRTPGRSVRTALARLTDGRERLVFAVLNATRKPFLNLS